jgi:hypothetical protein
LRSSSKLSFTVLAAFILSGCHASSPAAPANNSYSTSFPLTENPISQGGKWINGKAVGLDWTDVQTTSGTPGEAFSTKTGTPEPPYNDSIAVLSGAWGPNQTACGTAYINSSTQDGWAQEVELELNFTITAHNAAGYQFTWHATTDNSSYFSMGTWNGPLNNFTRLYGPDTSVGLENGDVVCATHINGVISAYKNGVLIHSLSDSTYTGGSPGLGFDGTCPDSTCDPYVGFTSFSASDDASGIVSASTKYGVLIVDD